MFYLERVGRWDVCKASIYKMFFCSFIKGKSKFFSFVHLERGNVKHRVTLCNLGIILALEQELGNVDFNCLTELGSLLN